MLYKNTTMNGTNDNVRSVMIRAPSSYNDLHTVMRGTDNCLYINYQNDTSLSFDFWGGWRKKLPCQVRLEVCP